MEVESGAHVEYIESSMPEALTLAHPPQIEEVVREIGRADWNAAEVRQIAQGKGVFDKNNARPDLIQGAMGEACVRLALERAAENDESIILDPVAEGAKTANYQFRYLSNGSLHAYDADGKQVVEYDEVFLARLPEGDVPVVIETKTRDTEGGTRNTGRVDEVLKSENVEKLIKPLQELYQTQKVGVVIAIPKEGDDVSASETRKVFESHGGVVAQFPFDTTEILEGVLVARFGK